MRKIKTSMALKYVKILKWGIWEMGREIYQNFLDGSDGDHRYLTKFDDEIGFTNEGVNLELRDLLIGISSKTNDTTKIGKFGEGLKLAAMTALVHNRKMEIISRSKEKTVRIKPQIGFEFGEEILVWRVDESEHLDCEEDIYVRVDIEMDRAEQDNMLGNFLDYQYSENPTFRVVTLEDEKYKSKLYVKGIFVQNFNNLRFGYNYTQVTTDRDRKMISSHDIEIPMKYHIWYRYGHGEISFEELLQYEGFAEENMLLTSDLNEPFIKDRLEEEFEVDIPCLTAEEESMIINAGHKARRVPEFISKAAKGFGITLESRTKKFVVQYTDVTEQHQLNENWIWAMEMVENISRGNDILIVDFINKKVMGLYRRRDGKVTICIASDLLNNKMALLSTIIHELAHHAGVDGSPDFLGIVDQYWQYVTGKLLDKIEELEGKLGK